MKTESEKKSTALVVTRDGMGSADQKLQHKLIKAYFKLLIENGKLPDAIAFYTDGVKLTTEGSPILEELKILAENGVLLIICSTCLNYFGLMDRVQVGIPSHLPDIIDVQQRADKVITI